MKLLQINLISLDKESLVFNTAYNIGSFTNVVKYNSHRAGEGFEWMLHIDWIHNVTQCYNFHDKPHLEPARLAFQ